ncbi:MAG: carbohydrate-binding protein, partial [Evtepia sp.]
WYLYTVNVGEASIYELTVTYATPQSTAEITIESDGVVGVVSRLSVTGSWTSFEEISIGTMKLDKGTHKIKFIVSRDSYTIDSIKFTDVEDQSTKINYSAKTGPYKNAILPTVIEAEDFDKGYGTGYKSVDDVNAGKEYRKADGIDTYKKDNGYTIKLLENEWVGYTFMVSKDGVYQLRIANEAAGKIDIYIDGQPTISNLTLEPITKFAEIAISNIAFQKGCHNIRLENKTSALNLDYIRFTNSSGEGITADMRIDGTKPKEETAGETHRVYRTIYVSPMGNDADSGSEKNPLKTIEAAKNLIGEISPGMDGDIIVLLYPGTYTLSQTQTFGVEDSGKNGFRVIYRGINPLDPPVISGGEKIGEWEKENDAIWKTKVETDSDIRQLYINGYPAQRARSKYLYKAKGYSYDAEGNEDGLILPTKNFPENFSQPSDLELVWNIEWTNQRQLARDIIQKGSETTILMKQPYF